MHLPFKTPMALPEIQPQEVKIVKETNVSKIKEKKNLAGQ